MKVILRDNNYKPSEQQIVKEFWDANVERQCEILYKLASLWCSNPEEFSEKMDLIGKRINIFIVKGMVLDCLQEMIDRIRGDKQE